MKLLYRPHRGSLEFSIAEVKEFDSFIKMFEYLVFVNEGAFDLSDIYISYYCYDSRIDWDTFVVTVGKYFDENYIKKYHCPQVIGFCTIK